MATPVPPEQVAESAAPSPAVDAQRTLPTPFLTKTYQLVDDPAIDDLISWNEDGSTFVVWRPAEFARDLLPKYFKHNNFSSFVRQLNTYGFRKIVPDRWEFANDCFRKGEKRLLCDIHRRKIQSPAVLPAVPAAIPVAVTACKVASPTNSGDEQALSSNSSPGAAPAGPGSGGMSPELVEENRRLRKENERLKHELSQMKNLCNSILLLMSKYANQQQRHQHQREVASAGGGGGGDGGYVLAVEKPAAAHPSSTLELMPLTRCSELVSPGQGSPLKPEEVEVDGEGEEEEEEERNPSPRLFGVTIGARRARSGGDESASDEQQPQQRRALEVKREPMDPPQETDQHRSSSWRLYSSSCRPPNQKVCN